MPTIISNRPQTKPHDGKTCTVVRSVTHDLDGEAFDVGIAKSVVKLEDGTEIVVTNIELQF
jgi:hypothetical protein